MKLQNCRNQGFSHFFCFLMEESGSRSGSVQKILADPDPRRSKTQESSGSGSTTLFLSILPISIFRYYQCFLCFNHLPPLRFFCVGGCLDMNQRLLHYLQSDAESTWPNFVYSVPRFFFFFFFLVVPYPTSCIGMTVIWPKVAT
jgi:hypothetical protein